MTKKEQSRIQRAYVVVAEKNPSVTNPRVLELLTRDYIKRRKLLQVALVLLCSVACLAISSLLEKHAGPGLSSLLQLIGGVAALVGVCKFAKFLHDPLTPNEEQELRAVDAVEKGGETRQSLSQYDRACYYEYLQEKRQNASWPIKCWHRMRRISIFVYLVIGICLGLGISNVVSGVENVVTYEERNKNAVEVTASISHFEEYEDDEGEEWYKTHWKYTYEGEIYAFVGSHYSTTMEVGDTETILIDSQQPALVIENDGTIHILLGCGLLIVGLFILIYAMIKTRKSYEGFSILQLIWLAFALAALFFAGTGVYNIVSDEILAGIALLVLGVPMMLGGAWLFRIFSDSE